MGRQRIHMASPFSLGELFYSDCSRPREGRLQSIFHAERLIKNREGRIGHRAGANNEKNVPMEIRLYAVPHVPVARLSHRASSDSDLDVLRGVST